MKKRWIAVLLAATLCSALLVGCGSSEEDSASDAANASATESDASSSSADGSEEIVLKDVDVDKYVTLGEYKGLAVTLAAASVDDDEWNDTVEYLYNAAVTAENGGITDRAVEEGDTVNIDYVGKKDDVAFSGGTASGAQLTIGSDSYIDGFEDGLIGVMPGETVDLNLTFPENYSATDLAGQDVVFTVTVNFIMPTEMLDEVVAGMDIDESVTDVESLRQYVYDFLMEEAESDYETSLQNAVMDAFMANNTVTGLPDGLSARYEETARESIEDAASTYGVEADVITNYYYGMDFEDFVTTYSEEAAKQDLALQALANTEGLNISDEELEEMILEYAQAEGYDSVDEYIGDTSREYYREYFMYQRTLAYLVDNAVITNE